MTNKQATALLRRALKSLLRACKKYDVDFNKLREGVWHHDKRSK